MIDGAPEVHPLPGDPDHHLIQMPSVARPRTIRRMIVANYDFFPRNPSQPSRLPAEPAARHREGGNRATSARQATPQQRRLLCWNVIR
jgi:hypothetical protein